jgi:hypothetical protein
VAVVSPRAPFIAVVRPLGLVYSSCASSSVEGRLEEKKSHVSVACGTSDCGASQQSPAWSAAPSTTAASVALPPASWDQKKVIEATDRTLTTAGKVGVWTKADSVTYFDDLKVEAVPQ